MKVTFGGTSASLWGHFEHIDVEFHVQCMWHAYMYGLGGAEKGEKLKNCRFSKGQSGHGDSREELQLSEPRHFGVILRHFGVTFAYIRVTLGYFRITWGVEFYFGCISVDFQKTPISPNRFL